MEVSVGQEESITVQCRGFESLVLRVHASRVTQILDTVTTPTETYKGRTSTGSIFVSTSVIQSETLHFATSVEEKCIVVARRISINKEQKKLQDRLSEDTQKPTNPLKSVASILATSQPRRRHQNRHSTEMQKEGEKRQRKNPTRGQAQARGQNQNKSPRKNTIHHK